MPRPAHDRQDDTSPARRDADGPLALHISNRHLNLEPVVGNLASDAGIVGLVQHDKNSDEEGKTASTWALLARREADLGTLADDARWRPRAVRP